MEITINLNNVDIKVPTKTITGIIFDNNEFSITSDKKICIVKSHIHNQYYNKENRDLMQLEIKNRGLVLKDEEKKIIDSLKIVGLKSGTLNKNFSELSSSEKKLFMLALALLDNAEVLIIKDPFLGLDLKNEKKLSILFRKMKDEYNKTIIFITNDSEIIYKYAGHMIIIKEENILMEGIPSDVYQKISFLNRNKINIPDIVKVTYLAKKNKGIKIDYHKDVRDIIKDIYKHV